MLFKSCLTIMESLMARPKKEAKTTPAAAPEAQAAAPAPEAKKVTVYMLNPASDEETGPKKAVKDTSVGGVILEAISGLETPATKSAILEAFRVSEKASSLKAEQWVTKPQEYVNGYVDWLKGNRSLVSDKVEV